MDNKLMSNSQSRNYYIDFLKGISILAVIVGHSIDHIDRLTPLFNFIYSFHMPLLFFASAYIEEQNREKYKNVKYKMPVKRIQGLLFPYISWNIIYILVGYRIDGLWFFPVLFGIKLVHFFYWYLEDRLKNKFFSRKIVSPNRQFACEMGMSILLCACLEIFLSILAALTRQQYIINMLSYMIPYFCAVIIVEYPKFRNIITTEWGVACAMLFYILLFPYFSFQDTRWTTQLLRIILSLCIIAVCCKMEQMWRQSKYTAALCYFGKYSLSIYVMHVWFLDYTTYLAKIESVSAAAIAAIAAAVMVAFLCTIIAHIIECSAFASRLLLGKEKSKSWQENVSRNEIG